MEISAAAPLLALPASYGHCWLQVSENYLRKLQCGVIGSVHSGRVRYNHGFGDVVSSKENSDHSSLGSAFSG